MENLFCVREVLAVISNRLARDANADFQTVSEAIFSRLQGELEAQVSLRAASEIKFQLNMLDEKQKGVVALKAALQSLANGIDVDAIYSQTLTAFNQVIAAKDFEGLLALYNRKSLSSQASGALGLANGGLPELVVRLARGDCCSEISDALRKYFGNFAAHIA